MTPAEEAPAARGWDVYAIAQAADPHAQWRKLRETTPVFDAGDGVFFITSWQHVHDVLHDTRFGAGEGVAASFGNGEGLVFDAMRAWLMSLDGAPHTRARGLVRREFTPRQIDGMRPRIVEVTEALVAEVESTPIGQSIDLVPKLAFALPSQVIRSLFGFPEAQWANEIEPLFQAGPDGEADALATLDAVARYFERAVTGEVPEGLLSQLQVPDPELGSLSQLEVIANAVLLVTAAIDTTAGLIGSALRALLERPPLLARVRKDPNLVPAVVEETLRFEPSALSCSRHTALPITLGGVDIPAGSQLLLGLAAANRDPERYAKPDAFDIERDHSGLLSFGGGRHFCLGAALARAEAQVAIDRLLVRGKVDFDLEGPPSWDHRNPTVRALARLPVRVRAK
jgi:cytochrome P450